MTAFITSLRIVFVTSLGIYKGNADISTFVVMTMDIALTPVLVSILVNVLIFTDVSSRMHPNMDLTATSTKSNIVVSLFSTQMTPHFACLLWMRISTSSSMYKFIESECVHNCVRVLLAVLVVAETGLGQRGCTNMIGFGCA